jgi:hypothetical protein
MFARFTMFSDTRLNMSVDVVDFVRDICPEILNGSWSVFVDFILKITPHPLTISPATWGVTSFSR